MTNQLEGFDLLYREGVAAVAQKNKVSIPRAALDGLIDLIATDKLLYIPNLVNGVKALNPGDTYTEGLWTQAHATDVLRNATKKTIEDLANGHADEHIEPAKRAFTWHTGEEI